LARPNICLLIISMRLSCPSTCPELQPRVSPALTASQSLRSPAANVRSSGRALFSASRYLSGELVLAAAVDEHLGEPADELAGGVQVGAPAAQLGEQVALGGGEVVRAGERQRCHLG
jgi:hypothetical protein